MDDVSLSAREVCALLELEKNLRRQDRELDRRMRVGGCAVSRPRRGPGPVARVLTALSAVLMGPALRSSGRWTRRVATVAFTAVWALARAACRRNSPARARADAESGQGR
ncbi:DUF3040 domain-containing protein [Streptomyces sp. NBC_01190]|uniref:DUF3040 domain-containing protein n=1 Tax=Streptomyces sp. NBC_01190 TaxID=2903767 RepID=UPI003869A9EE|nr:DUF3040 domain-containing protein [Streptomyces sp. NBC_01190]